MRPTFPAIVTAVLTGFVASCSSSSPDAPPVLNSPPTRTPAGTADAGAGDAGQDASLRTTRWHGTIDTLPAQSFGNNSKGNCIYQVTLSNVIVDLLLDDAGKALEGTVQNRMVEENVSCNSTTLIPPNTHQYNLEPGGDVSKTVVFDADSHNNPPAYVVLAASKKNGTLDAAMEWHRNDKSGGVYQWIVSARLTLSPVTP